MGHFYRETGAAGGLPQSDTDERKPVGAAQTPTFALRANGSAYALTMERWQGHCNWMRAADAPGEKALVISTTLFCEADYRSDWELPMSRIIADWGMRCPGAKSVEPVYFYEVAMAEAPKLQERLRRAYELGRSSPPRAPTPASGVTLCGTVKSVRPCKRPAPSQAA